MSSPPTAPPPGAGPVTPGPAVDRGVWTRSGGRRPDLDDPRVRGVETSDPAVAHSILSRIYRLRELTPTAGADFRFGRAVSGDERFAMGEIYYRGQLHAVSEPLPEFFCVSKVLEGRYGLADGRAEFRGRAGDRFVFPSDRTKEHHWDDMHLAQVMLDRVAVERELAGLSLSTPSEGLQTLSMEPVSAALGDHWGSTTRHVIDGVLSNDAAMASPLVRSAAFRSLVTAFVEAFETNVSGTGGPSDARALPSTVRRALAFVEEHAHDDIGIVEVAEAARLTPRGLQLAFRRHLDTTPMAALRAARLRGAHADLTLGDPTLGHTVAGIALSWGFANPGRFAAMYSAQFGRTPRETLES
jgi:AraC-like DNA-binding protein